MIQTCCEQFEWLLSNAGKAGLSAILRRSRDRHGFFLQGRACDAEQEAILQQMPRVASFPSNLRIVTQMGMMYCPFCGASLATMAEANIAESDELAARHKVLELGRGGPA